MKRRSSSESRFSVDGSATEACDEPSSGAVYVKGAPLPSPAANRRSAPAMNRTLALLGQMMCESAYRSLMSIVSLKPAALFGVLVTVVRKPRNMLTAENAYDAVVVHVAPFRIGRSRPALKAILFVVTYAF